MVLRSLNASTGTSSIYRDNVANDEIDEYSMGCFRISQHESAEWNPESDLHTVEFDGSRSEQARWTSEF